MSRQIAVRILQRDKILKSWTFINLNSRRSPYTYQNLFSDIKNGNVSATCDLALTCDHFNVIEVDSKQKSSSTETIQGDPNEDMLPAIDIFENRFFTLVLNESCQECNQPKPEPVNKPPNAFQLLMQSARDNKHKDDPKKLPNPTNGKELLLNEFITYCQQNGSNFPVGSGKPAKDFVNTVVELYFYIDGHYEGMSENIFGVSLPNKMFHGFNKPEKSKHRKRQLNNLSMESLEKKTISLKVAMQAQIYMNSNEWKTVRGELESLVDFCDAYIKYLKRKNKKMATLHQTPRENDIEKEAKVFVCPVKHKTYLNQNLIKIKNKIEAAPLYEPIFINEEICSSMIDRRRVYDLIQEIRQDGLGVPCVLYVHHVGGQRSNMNFVWTIDDEKEHLPKIIKKCIEIGQAIQEKVPTYQRRITKKAFKERYGNVASKVALRTIFEELTDDHSTPENLTSKEINDRFKEALNSEDPGILVDLRQQPPDHKKDTYKVFFDAAASYIQEDVGVAVQERRHGNQLYLAKAVSFKALHKTIKGRVPEGTPIPSIKWLRYQAQPRYPNSKTAKLYHGRFNIKMMVQKRQVRSKHVDAHYCAAAWRYLREYAIKNRDMCTLVSMDDKHKIKVGEPGYPLAAAERGKQVIVAENEVMAVGDHDFSKSTLTPSVNFIIDVPGSIEESFYRGDVFVGIKDSVLQPSSPFRHACELKDILLTKDTVQPILLIYSDGGPDHRCTYMSVKLSLISIFKDLNLDILIALRTAPGNSWANPVERLMSIVNLGLQGVGVMRKEMSSAMEKKISGANNLKEMRDILTEKNEQTEWENSISAPKKLISEQMKQLDLKDKAFQIFNPADEESMAKMWDKCLEIEESLKKDSLTAKDTKSLDNLQKFLHHCCVEGQYTFQIKKCGGIECSICEPLRDDRCKDIGTLPFPVQKDDHFKPFSEVYNTKTNDKPPSKTVRPAATRTKIPFSPSVQHIRNSDTMVQCGECDKWRLVFSKKKLNKFQKEQLEKILADLDYTCGFLFDDIELPNGLQVYIKDHDCGDHIEKLYYAAEYQPICIHCGDYLHGVDNESTTFPQCEDCLQPVISKR